MSQYLREFIIYHHDLFLVIAGAGLAIIFTVVCEIFKNAARLIRYRELIVGYLKNTAKGKLERYISDCEASKKTISDFFAPRTYEHDSMPMLTSEVFKSISTDELYRTSFNNDTYLAIVNYYYCLDFLKSNLPSEKIRVFTKTMEDHFRSHGDKTEQECKDHVFREDCQSFKNNRDTYCKNIDLNISTAKNCLSLQEKILAKLKGPNLI